MKFGSLEFHFQEDGRLQIKWPPMLTGVCGILLSVEKLETLIDFLMVGYKEAIHKGVEGPRIDHIWEKIEAKLKASELSMNDIPVEATETEKLEDDFRKTCIEEATKAIKEGRFAEAAKILEMYETI